MYHVAANRASVFNTLAISTGSVSFLCSLLMVLCIKCSKKSASTSYRRLIYKLSIADMALSVACFTGPFSSPQGTDQAVWGVSNEATCSLNAFSLFMSGSIGVASCMLALCFYYLHRLKEKKDDAYSRRVGKRFQTIVIIWIVVSNITCWATGAFNPDHTGTYCLINESPIGCDDEPDVYGECKRGKHSHLIGIVVLFMPWVLSFFGMLYCMVSLVWHAKSKLIFSGGIDVPPKVPHAQDVSLSQNSRDMMPSITSIEK